MDTYEDNVFEGEKAAMENCWLRILASRRAEPGCTAPATIQAKIAKKKKPLLPYVYENRRPYTPLPD